MKESKEIGTNNLLCLAKGHALTTHQRGLALQEYRLLRETNQTLRDQVKELKEGVEGILKTEGSPTCHPSEVLPNWARSSLKSLLTKDTKNN